jgi:hypothetical protein
VGNDTYSAFTLPRMMTASTDHVPSRSDPAYDSAVPVRLTCAEFHDGHDWFRRVKAHCPQAPHRGVLSPSSKSGS